MRGVSGEWIVILLIALAITFFVARSNSARAKRESERASRLSADIGGLRGEVSSLQATISKLGTQHAEFATKANFRTEGLIKIIEQRKSQFPWLASALADLRWLEAERDARFLATKKHPALRGAEVVRDYGQKRRDAERELRVLRYRTEYYEKLFPWITDYVGDDIPDSAVDVSGTATDADDDPAANWLSKAEYENLPTVEKYERALANWKRSKKSRWQIGRDYERYVGYLYETQGYEVEFTGAIEGFEDMGRDVIAKRGAEFVVVQCKYWSSEKEIREKHIFQLFGSTLEYAFRLSEVGKSAQIPLFADGHITPKIKPVLYTSTRLSNVARDAAKKLQVLYFENARISDYPLVKCNVALRDGQKIYHLPFDQQYDRVKIKQNSEERYVYTVAEAEKLGFRRAWRWRSSGSDATTTAS